MGLKILLVLVVCASVYVFSEDTNSVDVDYPTLNPDWNYCYEYTWLGPDYNNVTGYNGTCDDYIDDTRAGENIPCISPIVISNDGTQPDINYLWTNHRASVLCMMSEGQVCVKYSFLYNGIKANESHMCARVRTEASDVTSGCYSEKKNGYTIEMCVCKSSIGLTSQPCNSGTTFGITGAIIMVALLAHWIGK